MKGVLAMRSFLFGYHRGALTASQIRQREAIARRHDAVFVYADMPGEGFQSWFAGENLGEPFNSSTARGVEADLLETSREDAPPTRSPAMAAHIRAIENKVMRGCDGCGE